ncbi:MULTISPECIES: Na+/H+ antiporter [Acidobacteriaceae]|uniref:Na+/H+ antiporter n=1 Tax=Acidobacteriaceae TaxID=204434 RepID=UPI00131A76CF|nr:MULTISPECIES: Na+/H+ antiporter [Acidobacteriaceae]MDW5264150.1 Na+/H+ antiporter [Edaphobacter sp.]
MPSGTGLHALETVILLLLIMVAVFAVIAHRLKVPYPIVLVLAGLVISFVPHMPRVPLDPSLVFLIFLPPLLYSAAWGTSWREFRHNLVLISLLAVGLVGFTVWGVAVVSEHFITALDWKAGFLLGAVVATTDAIAATSIARSIGLPRRIVDILEGESLLNDATGLLALELGLSIIMRGETPSVGGGILRLLYLIVGGVGVGLLIGVVVGWLEKFIDDGPVEIVVSVVVPYAAYLAGEHIRASGVLAVVACGLYLSRKSATFFSPGVRIQVMGVWDALTFILNGLVFVLIGLQLPYVLAGIRGAYGMVTLLEYGAIFSVILIVLRVVWVFPAVKMAYLLRRWSGHGEKPPGARDVFVIGWTGMRGVVALAAAISVPEVLGDGRTFGPRNLIVFLAFCVILVTLVVQGLTLPSLIRVLGLAGATGMSVEEREARKIALQEAIAYLEEGRKNCGDAYFHAFDDLLDRYQHRLAEVESGHGEDAHGHGSQTYRQVIEAGEGAVQAERRAIIRLRDEGRISDDVLRTMEREFDLEESRYQVARL